MEGLQHSSTAIVVFVRSAANEAKVKSFSLQNNHRQSVRVADRLNQRAIEVAKKTGLPVIIGDESLQSGNTFGSRLESVLQHGFNKGYERLMVIGNDCLDIHSGMILKATQQLDHKDMVIGPTLDGGIYLVGFHKNVFNRLKFVDLPWQTDHLFAALKQVCKEANLTQEVLKTAEDADNFQTLWRILSRIKHLYFGKLLLGLVIRPIAHFQYVSLPFQSTIRTSHHLRGPPMY